MKINFRKVVCQYNYPMSKNECIICFETFTKETCNYVCRNDCFFNNKTECHICNKCLDTWVSYDVEETVFKCPICAQRKLKDNNEHKCEYHCSCNIGCNNIIVPEGIFFYRNERFRENCRHMLLFISFFLFLGILGFALTNAWFRAIKYDHTEYTEQIRNKKWSEPSYYLVTCPFASISFFTIICACVGFARCLENVC